MSQSRLDTRPSMPDGTWCCFAVIQTIVPAVSSALKAALASISCQTAVPSPYPATARVAIVQAT